MAAAFGSEETEVDEEVLNEVCFSSNFTITCSGLCCVRKAEVDCCLDEEPLLNKSVSIRFAV